MGAGQFVAQANAACARANRAAGSFVLSRLGQGSSQKAPTPSVAQVQGSLAGIQPPTSAAAAWRQVVSDRATIASALLARAPVGAHEREALRAAAIEAGTPVCGRLG